jgi:phosphotransferase system enzyme I (PtsI)
MKLLGNAVSSGIVLGKIFYYEPFHPQVSKSYFLPGELDLQMEKYRNTKEIVLMELTEIYNAMAKKDLKQTEIFACHIDILNDAEMEEEIHGLIARECLMPDAALDHVFNENAALLAAAPDPLIRERAADIQDVRNRFLRIWMGVEERNLSHLSGPAIIAAHDLLPSDTATIDRENVLGILTENGSLTSHSAILAKSFDIPAILGIKQLMEKVRHGMQVILDTGRGEVFLEPDQQLQNEYRILRQRYLSGLEETKKYLFSIPRTKDGVDIEIGMNTGGVSDADLANVSCADFVGLFRTEFLYMNSDHVPTEDEQFEAYKKILLSFEGKPVTLRTLDVGGDKTLPYMELPREDNPFLGCRALRFCLENQPLFRQQLRAALRASVYGKLWIMFPMVGALDEIRTAKAILDQVKTELQNENIPFDGGVKVGIMIEVPSIAIIADKAAREVDFASIGSNDLVQYLTASDRMNPQVSPYYQSFHPAVFRLIGQIARAFNSQGKPIGICGEMGGDPLAVPVLAGLGIRKFSMNRSAIAKVKRTLAGLEMPKMEELAASVQDMETEVDVKNFLHRRLFLGA